MKDDIIIISLGGSLIVPDDVDAGFLKDFRELILAEVKRGRKFIIITGGGKICRRYNAAAEKVREVTSEELDWLGIHSTRFNAHLLRILFGEQAEHEIITDPMLPVEFEKPIVLGGGWRPGNSTDLVGIVLAEQVGAKTVVNLSNTDYIYDSDPKQNLKAKKIEKISWADYRALIPSEWKPGLSTPFDPVASDLAEKEGITVVVINGKPIDNFRNFLNGENFQGSTIS
ncbi:MAG TPA: UMP kinase [Candidatus Paceibacterota bacterium]|jgi:uridylate kinase|nr:UMP kinase [Candidatus Paceibacterota bacterium]